MSKKVSLEIPNDKHNGICFLFKGVNNYENFKYRYI